MNGEIRIKEKIELQNSVMIMGLDGWGNAGEVSTFAVKYLADTLNAKKIGEILPEKFHDYLIQRPIVSIERGMIQSYISPRNDLYYWRNTEGGTNLVLLLGNEPHLNWAKYAESILELAEMGVNRIYTIGGYLADISYESETPITGSTNNSKLIAELKKTGVELTNYNGPTSLYGEILWKAKDKKIDVVSLWCATPLYVRGLYPKAVYCVLKKITKLVDMNLDLEELKNKAEAFKKQFKIEAIDEPQTRETLNIRRRRKKETTYIS